jgi:adenylate kinase family enzyme
MTKGIMIIGACGGGKTTLAAELAEKIKCKHIEMDRFVWLDNATARDEKEWKENIENEILKSDYFVMDGATAWAAKFIPYFDIVIFLDTPAKERVNRVKKREKAGQGSKHNLWLTNFTKDIAKYDDEDAPEWSSRKLDQHFLTLLPCKTLHLTGTTPLNQNLQKITQSIP